MLPCPSCKRHLRESEIHCPFCGANVATAKVSADSCLRSVGVVALSAFALLGSVACSKDGGSSDANTTTNGSTTVDDGTTAMTETATDTDDDPTSTTTTAGSFYAGPDPDFWSPSHCDPWAQDCPEGEKCVAYASTGGNWDANKCVPVNGDGQPGEPCTYGGRVRATDDCDATSYCWDDDVDGTGTCVAFCGGVPDDPECAEGTGCVIANDGSLTLCIDLCDPVAQDCGEGQGCYWTTTNFICLSHSGGAVPGGPCGFWNDCEPGHTCVDGALLPECGGTKCCAAFCSITAPSCTAPGTECVPFFGEGQAPPELVDVGVCTVP